MYYSRSRFSLKIPHPTCAGRLNEPPPPSSSLFFSAFKLQLTRPFQFLLPLHFLSSPSFSLSLIEDGFFLLQSKLSLADPSNSLSSWNDRDATPCRWYGVTCGTVTGAVTAVNLSNSRLYGPFPTALCRLPSVSSLSMSNNFINSSLSSDIACCRCPQHLDLIVCPIPKALSKMPTLRHLDLSSNNLSGDIPASFDEFPQFETLILNNNLLNGTIPSSLGNISTLKLLHLAYNSFVPNPTPSELGNLTNLEELWLAFV